MTPLLTDCCQRCAAPLAPGSLRFKARLTLWGDTGGQLPAPAEDDSDNGALERLLNEAAAQDEAALMADVVEEFVFVLCPACRRRVQVDPAGRVNVPAPRGASQ